MASSQKPLVVVSKSEPDNVVAQLTAYGVNATWGEAGTDYVFYPHGRVWGIERKRIDNLLGSLKDRQLVEQTQRGVKQYDTYILLLEGEYEYRGDGKFWYQSPRDPRADQDGWVESGWQWRAIDGMLLELSLGLGAHVAHSPLWGTAEAVARIVLNMSSENHKFLRERQRPGLNSMESLLYGDTYNDAVWALCAIPGCGPEIAEALIREYSSLLGAVIALSGANKMPPVSDVKVNGKRIGAKRAAKMELAVTTEYHQ